jgi:hypothetical protein
MNRETSNREAEWSAGSQWHGGITKEMWTVVLADKGAWLPTDIFADTPSGAQAALDLVNHGKDKPSKTDGARVTKCIVSIYPPNDQSIFD